MREHLQNDDPREEREQSLYFRPCLQRLRTDSVRRVAIDRLPDIVLLEIFDIYREDPEVEIDVPDGGWKTLTQVCGRWRDLVFQSPQRLGLRIVCTESTPTSLETWPPFPIDIICPHDVDKRGVENIAVALERRDRLYRISITDIDGSALKTLAAAMRGPLPVLADFDLGTSDPSVPALPETFLGGSAPLLRHFALWGIPFPSFAKFILSATRLVHLGLHDIPHSGCISPDVMATCLAALPNLESLCITPRPSPTTRALLPVLTSLTLSGVSEYFEDFVDRIDAPSLDELSVVFLTNVVFGDIPRLLDFIGRTARLQPFNNASMEFSNQEITMSFDRQLSSS